MAIRHNDEREKLNKDEQNLISCDKMESINLLKGIKSRYILIDRFTYEGLDMVLLEYIRTWSSTNLELPGLHCLFIFIFLLTNNKTNFLEIDKICVLWSEDSNASRAQIIPSAPENPEALILSSDLDNTNLEAQILPQENLEIKNPEFVIEGVSLKHSDKDTNSLSLNIQINEVFGNFKINNEYHVEHKHEIENTKFAKILSVSLFYAFIFLLVVATITAFLQEVYVNFQDENKVKK